MVRAPLARAGVLLLAAGLAFAQDDGQGEPAGVRRALLIGINDYAARGVPDLAGCLNDVEAMRAMLVARFGCNADGIRTMLDGEATRAAILGAIDELVQSARPADDVFLFYAGHGSQVEDLDGDEADGRDETLVAQDSRTEGVPDITDDELHERLGQLRSRHAVVILDCCHSGTGTRGVSVRPRRVEPDTRTELYPRGLRTRAVVAVESESYVLMTGAADHQSALDGPIDGRYHGAFSHALTRSLAAAPADVSPRALFDGIEREMRRLGDEEWRIPSMPEPQLEGPDALLDQPLLPQPSRAAGEVVARLAWLELAQDDSGTLSLDASHPDVLPGSLWAIYPAGERAFAPDGMLAVGEVVSAAGTLSLDPPDAPVARGARATRLSPPLSDDALAVHFVGADAETLDVLQAGLRQRLPSLAAVPADAHADLVVDLTGDRCLVYGADGSTLIASCALSADDELIERLAVVLERCLTTAAVLAVDNPASSMQIEMRVGRPEGREVTEAGTRGFKVVKIVADTGPPGLRVKREGEACSVETCLQLGVRTSQDSYLTIVDVDAEGALTLLFPNTAANPDFHPQGFVTGGAWHLVPDTLEAGNAAGFQWEVRPPAGLDTLRVFACTDLVDAEEIRDVVRAAEAGVGTRGASAARRRLLELPRALAMRGFKVVRDDAAGADGTNGAPDPDGAASGRPESQETGRASDWTAASMTVRIVD